ncbi:MAG: MYXO-CTERM sorting domain-containing protein [Polyangiales bacterium]
MAALRPGPRRAAAFTALALTAAAGLAAAQPTARGARIPELSRWETSPTAPGVGAQALFVRSSFAGFPNDLADARDLIDGTSVAPAFDLWCGLLPYVDLGNGATRDSFGREDPTLLCLPFLDPARANPAARCRALPELPTGRYYMNGGAALRVQGWLAVREAGVVTFAWGHDDGFGFDLGGVTVFEFRGGTAPRVDRRAVRFARAGLYPFRLDWFDGIGGALIDWYRAPGDLSDPDAGALDARFSLVPREDLYPSGELPCTARCQRCEADRPVCDVARARCAACVTDDRCGPCERCAAGSCVADDTRAGCRIDAGAPLDAGAVADGGWRFDVEAPSPGAPQEEGCSCRAGSRPRSRLWWTVALMALTLRRRRR